MGMSTNHFRSVLFVLVIFQMRSADPLKENGADMTTFSDFNWSMEYLRLLL